MEFFALLAIFIVMFISMSNLEKKAKIIKQQNEQIIELLRDIRDKKQ
ncbi:hypothetical protein G4V62_17590 [Bacillaceae bacterium SIJ1]|nr:hypothetical protein [Litoribacterium kuwaitense]NGP46670.1 hypothetical protein [Litoribacterium kuwaitense]